MVSIVSIISNIRSKYKVNSSNIISNKTYVNPLYGNMKLKTPYSIKTLKPTGNFKILERK